MAGQTAVPWQNGMNFSRLSLADLTPWAELLAISFQRTTADMGQLLHYLHAMYPIIAWGAWDNHRIAAQYSCLLAELQLADHALPILVGTSVNMAVHPDYRGQGLVKQVAAPVYAEVGKCGGVAGVGFSNAAGVKVDQRSKGYGYQVVGKMRSTAVYWRKPPTDTKNLVYLTSQWPETLPHSLENHPSPGVRFCHTATSLRHRFACHPFRQYCFGVWEHHGVVVYRPAQLGPFSAVSLLAVYGNDIPQLLHQWGMALQQQGIHWIHLLSSPASYLLAILQQTAVCLPIPISRTPYYLTVKPLHPLMPPHLLQYGRWDCLGGDIL